MEQIFLAINEIISIFLRLGQRCMLMLTTQFNKKPQYYPNSAIRLRMRQANIFIRSAAFMILTDLQICSSHRCLSPLTTKSANAEIAQEIHLSSSGSLQIPFTSSATSTTSKNGSISSSIIVIVKICFSISIPLIKSSIFIFNIKYSKLI